MDDQSTAEEVESIAADVPSESISPGANKSTVSWSEIENDITTLKADESFTQFDMKHLHAAMKKAVKQRRKAGLSKQPRHKKRKNSVL